MEELLTANEARKLTTDSEKAELFIILNGIKNAAKLSLPFYTYDKELNNSIINDLQNLGYRITYIETPKYIISW